MKQCVRVSYRQDEGGAFVPDESMNNVALNRQNSGRSLRLARHGQSKMKRERDEEIFVL